MFAQAKLRLQALDDLSKRYRQVFGLAWRHRVEMDPPDRLAHERQFLPAVLALQETPVPPTPLTVARIIVTLTVAALLWSILGKTEIIAVAQGKTIPSNRVKVVQPIETASVVAIHVSEGMRVREGQMLVELDSTVATADATRVASDLLEARLEVARGEALLLAATQGKLPPLVRPDGVPLPRWEEEIRLIRAEFDDYVARLARLDSESEQRRSELRATAEQIARLEKTAPIAAKRAEDYRLLVQDNFVSEHAYLDKEQSRIEQESDLAISRTRTRQIHAAIAGVAEGRKSQVSEFHRIAQQRMNDGKQKAIALAQELSKAENKGRLLTLRAPISGTVQQLAIHTVGGVVTAGQSIMAVVPEDAPLVVEAAIENKDIGFVKEGQAVEVKFETFPFTRYGTIAGIVETVSRDAVEDPREPRRQAMFIARVRLLRSTINVDGKEIDLGFGMAASVEVKTGERRLIEFFLSPFLQAANESLVER